MRAAFGPRCVSGITKRAALRFGGAALRFGATERAALRSGATEHAALRFGGSKKACQWCGMP